jgi:hypothetical protein
MKYKKTLFLFFIITVIITISASITLSLENPSLTGNIVLDEYTHTKAICNETNFCQDYIITCKKNITKEVIPISGATVQHTKDWIDPRNNPKTLC